MQLVRITRSQRPIPGSTNTSLRTDRSGCSCSFLATLQSFYYKFYWPTTSTMTSTNTELEAPIQLFHTRAHLRDMSDASDATIVPRRNTTPDHPVRTHEPLRTRISRVLAWGFVGGGTLSMPSMIICCFSAFFCAGRTRFHVINTSSHPWLSRPPCPGHPCRWCVQDTRCLSSPILQANTD